MAEKVRTAVKMSGTKARTIRAAPRRARRSVRCSGNAPIDPVADRVVKIIAAKVRPEKIYLFGSRASGKAGPESDVDVLLLCSGIESSREIRLKTHRLFRHPSFSLDVFVLSPDEFETQRRVANTLAREVSETGILCHG